MRRFGLLFDLSPSGAKFILGREIGASVIIPSRSCGRFGDDEGNSKTQTIVQNQSIVHFSNIVEVLFILLWFFSRKREVSRFPTARDAIRLRPVSAPLPV